jgi:hypothetical protein
VRRLLLPMLAALLLTGPAHAAAPPRQWLAQESWPGGRQYDPRLERTVTFWGTGVPAAELLASVSKQAGVALGFDPPDDDNARICLNVYLNPKEPPTLRDALVQIGWVMDCAWAVEGKGEQSRYVLLHTDLADAQAWRWRAGEEMARGQREAQEAAERIGEEVRERVMARLEEARGALALSREAAIRAYHGKDDLLLLALLDPPRRALTRFVLTLPRRALTRLEAGGSWQTGWAQLTGDQRDLLREAMRPYLEVEGRRAGLSEVDWTDWQAVQSLGLRVSVTLPAGGVSCQVSYRTGESEGVVGRGIGVPFLHLASDPRLEVTQVQDVQSEIALRRALGEQAPDEELEQRLQEASEQRARAAEREVAVRRLAALEPLSAGNLVLLSSLHLPVKAEESYALWQIQGLVAAASGLDVVSDCFVQLPLPMQEAIDVLSPQQPPDLTAYQVLRLACASWDDPEGLMGRWGRPSRLSHLEEAQAPSRAEDWEWGDAGRFLRFRSRNRDLWRAALLPRETVATLHAWLEPFLPKSVEENTPLPAVEAPLDLQACGALLLGLTDAQRQWGGLICGADPTDWKEAYRRVWRRTVLEVGWRNFEVYSVLARLSAAQLDRLRTDGLVWEVDVFPPGATGELDGWLASECQKGDAVRLREVDAEVLGPANGEAESSTSSGYLMFVVHRAGGVTTSDVLPRNLLVRPRR